MLTKRIVQSLLALSLFVGSGLATPAAAAPFCIFETHGIDGQCFLVWGCDDGSAGFAYTDGSLCYMYA